MHLQYQLYLKTKGLNELTIRGYVRDISQFLEWLDRNGAALEEVTVEVAQQYLDFLVSNQFEVRPGIFGQYSPSTVQKKIVAVRSFFDFLVNHE
jgi:site-specific recombinase XerD